MSRIGRKLITIPEGVTVTINGSTIVVKGPKGTLIRTFVPVVEFSQEGTLVTVGVKNPEDREQRALRGLSRALLQNMITGVHVGFQKKLEIKGVGYRAEMKGKTLVLHVGYSHPVEFTPKEGVDIKVEKSFITLTGIDNQLVGEDAANIRKVRKPEPYKGKGIRYVDEHVRQKAGKMVKAAGA